MVAGPTEALIFANSGNAKFIAADLIAQAEHDPDAISIFVTTSATNGRAVARKSIANSPSFRKRISRIARLRQMACVLIAKNLEDAVQFVNVFAPEHLSLSGGAEDLLDRKSIPREVFFSAIGARKLLATTRRGTNHVLPTGGRGARARRAFRRGLREMHQRAGSIARGSRNVSRRSRWNLRDAESLIAHARSRGGSQSERDPVRSDAPVTRMRAYNPPLEGRTAKTASGFQRESHRLLARGAPRTGET